MAGAAGMALEMARATEGLAEVVMVLVDMVVEAVEAVDLEAEVAMQDHQLGQLVGQTAAVVTEAAE